METYNGKLCATYSDLEGILSIRSIQHQVQRGAIIQARRACMGTPALFEFDSLPLAHKTEVYRRNPDLKAQAESKPFIDIIEPDGAAIVFYQDHLLGDGKHLPTDKQVEYANNAAILNGFRARLEKSISRRANGRALNKTHFWKAAAQALPRIADKYPHSLPENPRRLQDKFNLYLRDGYASLITGKYGTRNRAKVKTDEQKNVIIKLLSDYRNLDNSQIADLYNCMCQHIEGWETITPRLVGVYREQYDLVTSAGRLGASNFRNVKAMQIKRSKPTAPLHYWTLDGWDVELYYQAETVNKQGHKVTTYHNRLTVVVVLDPSAMYPVGYAIGTHETPALIKEALRNAANHTAQLWGVRYCSNQLQSDHYGIKKMSDVYNLMGKAFTPAAVGNAKGKIIEPYFLYLNKEYCQIMPNWSGFGVTSDKKKQPNSDALNAVRKGFPTAEGCAAQIAKIMELERARKREAYLAGWSNLADDRKIRLSDEQYLLNFGAVTGNRNVIEGQGLRPTIEGVKRTYDCFDARFREYAHVRWEVMYDPENLNRALAVSEDGRLRFMLEEKYVQPMALADRREGDAAQLARVNNFNGELKAQIIHQLAEATDTTYKLIESHPALQNSLAKAILCDSTGQHKNRRNQARLRAKDIEDVEYTVVNHIPGAIADTDDADTIELY